MFALTRDELLGTLVVAKTARYRDYVMCLVGYSHALRVSEICELTADNISHDGYITVQRRKGSLRTIQPLLTSNEPLLDEREKLLDWARRHNAIVKGERERLFAVTPRQFERLFRRYALAAGVKEHLAHPHILKHTMGHDLITAAGITNTQQWLGHKSVNSTGAYLRVSDAEAAEAVTRALCRREQDGH